MLRMALNVDWKQRKTNKEVYSNLPRATMKIQERRMRLAGHIHRHPELIANRLLLWEPTHGVRSRENQPMLIAYELTRVSTTLEKWADLWRIEFYGDSASILGR